MTPAQRHTYTPEEVYQRARVRFMNVWTTVGVLLLLAATIFLMEIMSLPVSIAIWTLIFVFCLSGVVDWL